MEKFAEKIKTQPPQDHKVYEFQDWSNLHKAYVHGEISDLRAFWDEIQAHKYDGDLFLGDVGNSEFVFRQLEMHVVKELYPEEVIYPLVKKWVSHLLARAKKRASLSDFETLRKNGMSYRKAKETSSDTLAEKLIAKYSQPFILTYRMSSEDADTLHEVGLESFIKLYYDRFYVPVPSRKNVHQDNH